MHYLVEDPTYPLIALGVAALACLVALRTTQQGKFLVWAGGLAGIAALWFVVERLVVTDAERVEAVVYELADAVSRSDADAVAALLAPDVTFGRGGRTQGAVQVRLLLPRLDLLHFDYLRIRQLDAQAGGQTRRGSAEFNVIASGTYGGGGLGAGQPFPITHTGWSLGFREVTPGVWRVNRITPVRIPREAAPYIPGGGL